MSREARARAAGLLVLLAATLGCGESGSNPVTYPEVRFQVEPVEGAATFEVQGLAAGQIEYASLAGTVFTTTSIFNLVIEGGGPPYRGRFRQVGAGPILIRLRVAGGGPEIFRSSTGPDSVVVVSTIRGPEPRFRRPDPEVRFEVCAPVPGVFSCRVADPQPGLFGVSFTGNVGDIGRTFVLAPRSAADPVPATPSIYFLQKPRDAVSGVFRSTNESELVVRLFVDGRQTSVAAGTADVVVRADL